jgi:multiple sugar transport system substrate-binding protein
MLLSACKPQPDESENITRTTISFAAIEAQRAEYEALIAEFEVQNPDIDVKFVNLAVDPSNMSGFATQADAIALPVVPVGSDAYTYLDIQPLAETDSDFDPGGYLPGVMEGCQVDERQIGLPYTSSLQVIYYNRDIFDATGIAYTQPDWTWEEFRLNTINLTRRNGQEVEQYGFVNLSSMVRLLGSMLNRDLMISDEEEKAGALEKTLNSYLNLVQLGYVRVPQNGEYPGDLESLIYDGKAAMWLDGLFRLEDYRNVLGEQIGFLPVPEGTRATARCLAISAGSQQPQAVWRLIKYLSEQNGPFVLPNEFPSNSAQLQNNPNWQSFSDEEQAVLKAALDNAWYGTHWLFNDLNNEFNKMVIEETDLNISIHELLNIEPPQISQQITPVTPFFMGVANGSQEDIPSDAIYLSFDTVFLSREKTKEIAAEFNHKQSKYYVGFSQPDGNHDCYMAPSLMIDDMFYDIISLEPFIAADPEGTQLLADIPEQSLDATSVNGEIVGIPLIGLSLVINYNPALLKEVGLQSPPNDWTMDEFLETIQIATHDDIYGFVTYAYIVIYDAYETPLYDMNKEPPEFYFDTAGVKQTTKLILQLEKDEVIPPLGIALSNREFDRIELITSEKAAFWLNNTASGYLEEEIEFEPGTVGLPNGMSKDFSTGSLISFFISKDSKSPDGCWEWFKYFSNNASIFDSGIPIRKSILYSPEYSALIGADTASVYQSFYDQNQEPEEVLRANYEEEMYLTSAPYSWFMETLIELSLGMNVDIGLNLLQQKSEAYLTCMLNMAGTPGENYQTCMKLVDPDS